MKYLDTGCLLKFYYPEPNSGDVVTAVTGKAVAFTALHELEIAAALQLKRFRGEATFEEAEGAMNLVRTDSANGRLTQTTVNWTEVISHAAELARIQTAVSGCRSLDLLHCAAASAIGVEEFVSSDRRQIAVALAIRLRVRTI